MIARNVLNPKLKKRTPIPPERSPVSRSTVYMPERKRRLTSSGARLQIEGLTIIYDGEIAAVGGINLDVEPGEFVTLLGPSGSGKTSVLMAIAGFVEVTAGRILVDNDDLLVREPNQRNLGLVFQDYALFPHMSVAQNIGFPLKMRQWRSADIDAAVDEALRMVRLTGYGHRRPTQLSGGEQQRVALARATVFNPPVLLMDEPLGALDKQLRVQLQDELKAIQRRTGITTLYVTHDQSEAMTLSDRIALMRDGQIEQLGTPRELYEQPVNRFVAEFIGESNVFSGKISLTGNGRVLETESGWRLPVVDDHQYSGDERVQAMIRPERIVFEDPSADVVMRAEVIEQSYAGEMISVRVKLPEGDQLLVKRQNRGDISGCQQGQYVTVGWSYQDMTVLRG